ncbi:hypothetical protein OA58_23500 [Microcystis aeruginosa NIES-88]|uniref:hypothetical protein n=1 Tax=Microcystis aeruginosa TaxID=1126 RepID=UPI0007769C48|nr:hypothetical protein OA58_23500 [Microcystis aeruginosa NIES-88]
MDVFTHFSIIRRKRRGIRPEEIKTFYERLVGRGKSKKLALTACVRKILVILNAMVRQNQPWQLADNLPPCS